MLKNVNIDNNSIDSSIEALNISLWGYMSASSTEFVDLMYLLYTDVYSREFI